jgi:adenine-specific DNA-methyltransferase
VELNAKYSREQFIEFLNSFLPGFTKDIREVDVDNLRTLQNGRYLGKNEKLDLQVFELEHKVSPGSRVALASDGFRVMRDSASFQTLISYYNPNIDEWRLSLMMATPVINEKGIVATTLSNPKRYSYALGPGSKINTPYNFLIKKGEVNSFNELQERFSVEVVNKEFYKEIAELYTELVGGIRGEGKNKKEYKGLIKLPPTSYGSKTNHEFAVRLIGRIIFCWFLREKKSKEGLPLIPEEVLSLKAIKQNSDYYHSIRFMSTKMTLFFNK